MPDLDSDLQDVPLSLRILRVQIQREQVSGAVETEFLHKGYTNMYNNVTNIVLVVSPTARLHEKSVLVNAHFDSTLGTTGKANYNLCVLALCSIFTWHSEQ